jgi:hypothetical protein
MLRLLRPPLAASFLRSFRLHSPRYARETIAKNLLARGALVTASITQTGSESTALNKTAALVKRLM